ncbi:MAG TPA: hypothetical protein VNW99_12460 [Cytophagaceae bacterium]|jgi:hypothetical protein|nr:hypothetical protein [Cytophagaceae bacterium]
MKRSIYGLVFLGCCYISFRCNSNEDGRYVLTSDLGFKIEFPKEPTFYPSNPGNNLKYIVNKYRCKEGEDEFMISCFDYNKNIIENLNNKDSVELFFRAAIDGAITNSKGKLINEKDIVIRSHPGKEATIKMGDPSSVCKLRIYLIAKNKFHLLIASRPKDKSIIPLNYFFDSYDLIDE